jgi:uncharacterized membrane protein YjgN (DUF898 family)
MIIRRIIRVVNCGLIYPRAPERTTELVVNKLGKRDGDFTIMVAHAHCTRRGVSHACLHAFAMVLCAQYGD